MCLARLAALLRIILHLQGQAVRLGLYSAPVQQLFIGLVSTLMMKRVLMLIFMELMMCLLGLFAGLCEGNIRQIKINQNYSLGVNLLMITKMMLMLTQPNQRMTLCSEILLFSAMMKH